MLAKKVDQFFKQSKLVRYGSLAALALIIFLTLIVPISLRQSTYSLNIGDVAFQDIKAPRSFSYESEILTDEARANAERSVQPIYLAADPSINRKQLEKLRVVLNYIGAIRSDTYATASQKITDIQLLSDIVISNENAEALLELDDERWAAVRRMKVYICLKRSCAVPYAKNK